MHHWIAEVRHLKPDLLWYENSDRFPASLTDKLLGDL